MKTYDAGKLPNKLSILLDKANPSPLKLLSNEEIIIPLSGGIVAQIKKRKLQAVPTKKKGFEIAIKDEIIEENNVNNIMKTMDFFLPYPPNLEQIIPPNTIPTIGPKRHNDPKAINLGVVSIFNILSIYLSPQYCITLIPKKATLFDKVVNKNNLLHNIFPKFENILVFFCLSSFSSFPWLSLTKIKLFEKYFG